MSDSSTISSPLSRRGLLWICGGILVISCGLRVGGIFNAFWIDEIISWDIARAVQSPLQILTSVHHDNNHHLSTLWMYILGDGGSPGRSIDCSRFCAARQASRWRDGSR